MLSTALALVLCLSLLPAVTLTAAAEEDGIPYQWCDGNGRNWETRLCETYTVVDSNTTRWSSGWYVVPAGDPITIGTRVSVSGQVHLILVDGCNLTVNGGIGVSSSYSLTIYGQDEGSGKLTAKATDNNDAGIGGSGGPNGPIVINGGTVEASVYNNNSNGAGIGGGGHGEGRNITINGGTVTATAQAWGSGIGGAAYSKGRNITINGGTVTANGGQRGAGIGGGGAGIGGGNNGSGKNITITGGTVTASRFSAAPILDGYIYVATNGNDYKTVFDWCGNEDNVNWTSQRNVRIQPAGTVDQVWLTVCPSQVVTGRSAAAVGAAYGTFTESELVEQLEWPDEAPDFVQLAKDCPFAWTVGNSTAGSRIEDGQLIVDPGERAETLTVIASMGGARSEPGTVSVVPPFVIKTQPASVSVSYGYTAEPTLSVGVSGPYSEAAGYQWYKD